MTQRNYHEIKISIADDHETFIRGLISVFDNEEKFTIIDVASNGQAMLQALKKQQPDIILMDIDMPIMNGIEATAAIKKLYPDVAVIALTFKDDDESITEMMQAGASGYLIKSALKKEILEAIVTVYNGKKYFCNGTQLKLVEMTKNNNIDRHNFNKKRLFTERELEIIKYVCREMIAKEIAATLGVQKRTIENQKQKILEKMEVHNTAGLIMYAVKHKLDK